MTSEFEPAGGESLAAQLLALALELAGEAGELMLRLRNEGLSVSTKSSSTDLVTDADRAVEAYLAAEIGRRRPGDALLGEEGAYDDGSGSGVRWVIDPIDGTVNFLLGLPQFAVSIAAQLEGRTVAGVVCNPVSGDVFSARAGHGAFRGAQRLTGPRSVVLADAVIATGFGYDRAQRGRQAAVLTGLLPRVGNLRRMGSAALDLCSLASGWVDAYYEQGLNEWDYAAGLLIAQEAGLAVSGLGGHPAGPNLVAAAAPDLAADFFALLTELGVG
jgi:myo-inositol-1(or 4)-monophosphatase